MKSASRSLVGDFVALGTEDGHVSLQQVRFVPRYEDQKLVDLDLSVRDRGLVAIDTPGRPIREVAYEENDGRKTVLAVPADDTVLVWRTDDEGVEHRAELKTQDGEKVTRVRTGRSDPAVASTDKGNLYHWELAPEVRLTEVVHVSEQPITALEYPLGNITLIVGDARGDVSGWFRVRERGGGHRPPLREGAFLRGRSQFENQPRLCSRYKGTAVKLCEVECWRLQGWQ